jgi:ABC-type iron transport system FetAB permease component
MRWSVMVVAEGDQVMTQEQIVELADAVAGSGGIASGIGTNRYGAQLVVEADTVEKAIELGRAEFTRAAQRAGLPAWPIVDADAISEAEDYEL